AGAADQKDPHPRVPEDPERLPLAPAEERVLTGDLAVGRDPEELATARRAVVLDLGTQTVGRARPMNPDARVPLRRRDLVKAIAEAPHGASAQGGDPRMWALVRHARVETAEAPVVAGAHRSRRVGEHRVEDVTR